MAFMQMFNYPEREAAAISNMEKADTPDHASMQANNVRMCVLCSALLMVPIEHRIVPYFRSTAPMRLCATNDQQRRHHSGMVRTGCDVIDACCSL